MPPAQAPYGTWRSPVDGDAVAGDRGWMYSLVTASGADIYWSEARPLEGGRDTIVVRRAGAAPVDVIPADCSARTRVHEYGGGAYTLHGETVYFCHDADQRIHRIEPGGSPVPITPAPATKFGLRYADLRVTPDGRWVVCVRERDGDREHVNDLVAVPADGSGEPRLLASGHDFYSSPRVSPDGTRLAWLTWDHPRMPWEGSELWIAELAPGATLSGERLVAGGAAEAIVQPEWSPEGVLHYSSDRSGWWNLYRGEEGEALTALEAEIGGPLWVFGESWYAFLDGGAIVCTFFRDGRDHLAVVERPGALREVPLELTLIRDLTTDGRRALFIGASPTRSPRIVAADLSTGAVEPLSEDDEEAVDAAYVSVPRPLQDPHALFYPPHNPDFTAPPGERPPLIVRVHGGPTAHVTARLSPEVQFFTSRGFAVVDVNYGGSTGYGREYRNRLRGQWGVVDTEDAVKAALALAEAGEVDRERMAISGGSAGGWTVLCALAFHDGVFAAGADYFGVSDLSGFVDDTHKFESRYNDWLVGPWPEAAEEWRERSPINHADKIRAPVIVLQGLEDRVVPPSQSEAIVDALARNGVPHAYIGFEGEQHGFRKAENLRRAAEAELSFYAQVFGFELGDAIEPVPIVRIQP
jgi:dipeptidyl aminopeptidase/acylaminoacyl peptidase